MRNLTIAALLILLVSSCRQKPDPKITELQRQLALATSNSDFWQAEAAEASRSVTQPPPVSDAKAQMVPEISTNVPKVSLERQFITYNGDVYKEGDDDMKKRLLAAGESEEVINRVVYGITNASKQSMNRLESPADPGEHSIRDGLPELNVAEVIRDAEVGTTTLLNKHGGKNYKLSGLVLSSTPYDATLVIENTEIICTFSDDGWKDDLKKYKPYLYVAGAFESYANLGTTRRITMSKCRTIENFYKGRSLTPEEKQKALENYQNDLMYKLRKGLNADVIERGPNP